MASLGHELQHKIGLESYSLLYVLTELTVKLMINDQKGLISKSIGERVEKRLKG